MYNSARGVVLVTAARGWSMARRSPVRVRGPLCIGACHEHESQQLASLGGLLRRLAPLAPPLLLSRCPHKPPPGA